MSMQIIKRSLGTHDGTFHADEVTACALLLIYKLIDEDKVFRTRNVEELKSCEYVCDVGKIYDPKLKRFDHHQGDYTGDLSSAGMILKYLLDKKIITEKIYTYLNDNFVHGVDLHDIGKIKLERGVCTFSMVIANFLPIDYECLENEMNQSFFTAVHFTKGYIQKMLLRFDYIQKCKEAVQAAMEKGKSFLIFDKEIPWQEAFFELGGKTHPAKFLIMPSGPHWKLRAIPPTYENRMATRQPLPQEWAGLYDEGLKKVTHIDGAVFCHKGRFISIWETKEDAMKALNQIVE